MITIGLQKLTKICLPENKSFRKSILEKIKDRIKILRFFRIMCYLYHHCPGSQESIAKKEVFQKSNGKSLFRADFDFCQNGTIWTKIEITPKRRLSVQFLKIFFLKIFFKKIISVSVELIANSTALDQ